MTSPEQRPPEDVPTPEGARPTNTNTSSPSGQTKPSPTKAQLINAVVQLTDEIDEMKSAQAAHLEFYESTLHQLQHRLAALEGKPDTASMAGDWEPLWNNVEQALGQQAFIGPAEGPPAAAEEAPQEEQAENDNPAAAKEEEEDDDSDASISSAPPAPKPHTNLEHVAAKLEIQEDVDELLKAYESEDEDSSPQEIKELARTMSGSLIGEAVGVKGRPAKGSHEDQQPATPAIVTQKRGRPPSAEKASPSNAPTTKASKAEA